MGREAARFPKYSLLERFILLLDILRQRQRRVKDRTNRDRLWNHWSTMEGSIRMLRGNSTSSLPRGWTMEEAKVGRRGIRRVGSRNREGKGGEGEIFCAAAPTHPLKPPPIPLCHYCLSCPFLLPRIFTSIPPPLRV